MGDTGAVGGHPRCEKVKKSELAPNWRALFLHSFASLPSRARAQSRNHYFFFFFLHSSSPSLLFSFQPLLHIPTHIQQWLIRLKRTLRPTSPQFRPSPRPLKRLSLSSVRVTPDRDSLKRHCFLVRAAFEMDHGDLSPSPALISLHSAPYVSYPVMYLLTCFFTVCIPSRLSEQAQRAYASYLREASCCHRKD